MKDNEPLNNNEPSTLSVAGQRPIALYDGARITISGDYGDGKMRILVDEVELPEVVQFTLSLSNGKPALEIVRQTTPFNTHTRERAVITFTRFERVEFQAEVEA